MNTRQTLLTRIDDYLRRTGVTEAKFGKMAANDSRWVGRLRAGKVSLANIERAEALLNQPPIMAQAAE